MLIDNYSMLREKMESLIEIPSNNDVVVYNKNFIDLINVNVDKLYEDKLDEFNKLFEKYKDMNAKIEYNNELLTNIRILNPILSESKCIEEIQKLEKNYANKYKEVKILENKLIFYRNKCIDYQNRIEIQKEKDEKILKDTKKELENQKNQKTNEIKSIKKIIESLENFNSNIRSNYTILEEHYNTLKVTLENLEQGKYTCFCCGSKISSKKSTAKLEKKIKSQKNTIENQLNKYSVDFANNRKNAEELREKAKTLSEEVNEINLSIENIKFYTKKSKEVLKLESSKFIIEDQIDKIEQELKSKTEKYGKNYTNIKDKINTYKSCLENIKEIQRNKDVIKEYQNQIGEIKSKMAKLKPVLLLACDFIAVRYKLIEKRISALFDGKVEVTLFERDGYEFKKTFELYYNKIDRKYLSIDEQNELEKLITSKLYEI